MAYGFIYFLANPSMPGLTKIGMTHKHPRERMEQLTRATSCPQPFELIAYFDTPDPLFTEQGIHKALASYRVNTGREFFKAPYSVLQETARQWMDTAEGCAFTRPLDGLAHKDWVAKFNNMILAES